MADASRAGRLQAFYEKDAVASLRFDMVCVKFLEMKTVP
jgi:hypothetical protein